MRYIWLMMLPGCLTYEVFAERVVDTKCVENNRCSGSNGDCAFFQVPGAESCDFDPFAARRCLRDPWVCNADQPGFEFAEPPASCDIVCLDPVQL